MHKSLLLIFLTIISLQSVEAREKIVGGDLVREDSYKAVVGITKNGDIICSGVLIDNDIVLTAAHCLIDKKPHQLSVYIGNGIKLPDERIYIQGQFPVKNILIHPSVKPGANSTISNLGEYSTNDVGLLFLEKKVRKVRPFSILTREEEIKKYVKIGKKVTVLGFGYTKEPDLIPTGKSPASYGQKRMVRIPIVDINNHEVDLRQKGRDSCYVDSGGPAIIKTGKFYQILGIVSGSNGMCGEGEFPVFYALGYASSCWITEVTGIDLEGVGGHCYRRELVKSTCGHLPRKRANLCAKNVVLRDLFEIYKEEATEVETNIK